MALAPLSESIPYPPPKSDLGIRMASVKMSGLVQLLLCGKVDFTKAAATEIGRRALEPGACDEIYQEGAISVLVDLMLVPNLMLQFHVLKALVNISADPTSSLDVEAAGGLPNLLQLLSHTNSEIVHKSLWVLTHMAAAPDNHEIMRSSGLAPLLVPFLKGSQDPKKSKHLLQALKLTTNLLIGSPSGELQVSLQKCGIIVPLLRLLLTSTDIPTLQQTLDVVRTFIVIDAVVAPFCDSKGLQVILKLLQVNTNNDIVHRLLLVLNQLTTAESLQREVFLSNGLPLLIKFLAHHNPMIKLATMWCIFNLSNLVEAQQAIWNMKALKPLVQLLKTEKGEDEKCVLVGILGNLCQQEIVRQALVHMAAISPIVRLMWGKRYSLETNRNAVAAVRLLVYEPAAVRGVIQLGGVPRLIELIQSSDDRIREYSITALSNMALDELSRSTIIEKGGVSHFLIALEVSSDPYTQYLILAGLNNLLLDKKAQDTVRFSGQLEFIHGLSQEEVGGDPDKEWRQEQAFAVLASFEPREYGVVVPEPVLPPVVSLPPNVDGSLSSESNGSPIIVSELDALDSLMEETAQAPLTKPVPQWSSTTELDAVVIAAPSTDAVVNSESSSSDAATFSEKDIWGADGLDGFMDSMNISVHPPPIQASVAEQSDASASSSSSSVLSESAESDTVVKKSDGSLSEKKVTIKCTWCSDTKLVRVMQSASLESTLSAITAKFMDTPTNIKFKDEDGDWVDLESADDWEYALEVLEATKRRRLDLALSGVRSSAAAASSTAPAVDEDESDGTSVASTSTSAPPPPPPPAPPAPPASSARKGPHLLTKGKGPSVIDISKVKLRTAQPNSPRKLNPHEEAMASIRDGSVQLRKAKMEPKSNRPARKPTTPHGMLMANLMDKLADRRQSIKHDDEKQDEEDFDPDDWS